MIDLDPIKKRLEAAKRGEIYAEAAKRDVEVLLVEVERLRLVFGMLREQLGYCRAMALREEIGATE